MIQVCYHKVPKFSDARKFCCNLSKVQIKRSFDRKYCADGMTNSVDPDQTAPRRSSLTRVYTVCTDLHVSVRKLRVITVFCDIIMHVSTS